MPTYLDRPYDDASPVETLAPDDPEERDARKLMVWLGYFVALALFLLAAYWIIAT